eukprot:3833896-Lingulodinium_polyedra.AAC.1
MAAASTAVLQRRRTNNQRNYRGLQTTRPTRGPRCHALHCCATCRGLRNTEPRLDCPRQSRRGS